LYIFGAYLIEKFFTNKSYAILAILIFIIVMFFNIILKLESLILKLFGAEQFFVWNWGGIAIQILLNFAIGMIIFGVIKFFTSKLRLNALRD
jgi:flagellar biosynthesis protein FlhB